MYHSPNYTLSFLRRAPCPMVLTLYGASLFVMPSVCSASHAVRVRFLIGRSARRAEAIVFGSRHAQSEFGRPLGSALPSLQRPIYMGVPEGFTSAVATEPDLATLRAKYDLPGPYVIATGSIHPRKNYEPLIEALSGCELSGVRLVICCGVGWKTQGFHRALEAAGMCEGVTLTGYVHTGELRGLLQGAALMVFPSLYEGFSIPPREAFALGVPVCASNTSSIPEMVGDAAVLFDPLSVREMASAMSRALRGPPLREDLIRRGRLRLQHLSWEQCAREHMDLHEAVAARRKR